jgi:hypothetical protein
MQVYPDVQALAFDVIEPGDWCYAETTRGLSLCLRVKPVQAEVLGGANLVAFECDPDFGRPQVRHLVSGAHGISEVLRLASGTGPRLELAIAPDALSLNPRDSVSFVSADPVPSILVHGSDRCVMVAASPRSGRFNGWVASFDTGDLTVSLPEDDFAIFRAWRLIQPAAESGHPGQVLFSIGDWSEPSHM